MRHPFRRWAALMLLCSLLGASGCQMFDTMHPENTWKLNRGPAMDEGDAYFSVSDPAATVRDDSASSR